ncbi:MAG TPA: phosphatase PAP2 family protein, partial [Chitinophagaceae bacterium]|nr:phosphatase PAP2 family protein [Chitinophagaceae bacterium]
LLSFIFSSVFFNNEPSIDKEAFAAISPYIASGTTRVMTFISFLGKHSFLIPANLLLILVFMLLKKKWMAVRVVLISLSSLGLMSLLKNLLKRQRPPDPLIEGITNFSFPSGHAFMSMAFYGLLIWFTIVSSKNKWQKNSIIIFLSALILAISFSRIYLRVHYATDVVAGLLIGFLWLIACLFIIQKIESRFINKS